MPKILIADDYELTVTMLTNILTEVGYDVVSTNDGKNVVEKIQAENPDLLILDVYMPEQDGIQTLIKVKQLWPGLPVISISGGGKYGLDYSNEMKDLGSHAFFPKPVNTQKLLAKIASILG